jgi:hypothetical protein
MTTEFAAPTETSTSTSAFKRKRGREKDQDDENNDGRNPKQPRTLSYMPQDAEEGSKFACPFRKNNPGKYSVREWRSCALTPLETVARVKYESTVASLSNLLLMTCRSHLYRHHRIFPCQRCRALFPSQEKVDNHLKELEPCPLREAALGDGITSDIVDKLKSRKKSDKNQKESERWVEIYKLLFPHAMVPDPCT